MKQPYFPPVYRSLVEIAGVEYELEFDPDTERLYIKKEGPEVWIELETELQETDCLGRPSVKITKL